ncbi:uncharacterized protein LOC116020867 [Ipomoea triloba]|uniref:uncharacterized protein LOC116020867 n=1 Tax=Ipomoea triloba TaxID=35885 RepID=UPI00125CFB6C|nr:uncharacterized protein LOC116020867 [Ipomoea triloba]
MVNSNTHPEVVLIKQDDDKFFSRLLTKENCSKGGESSLRFYYYEGSSGSIPFCWESQPGTPKPSFNGGSTPPLTPPPSYQSSAAAGKSVQKASRKPRFLCPSFFFFHKGSSKKTVSDVFAPNSLWSPSASPSCSSSFSSSSAVALNRRRHRRSRSDVGFDEYGDPVVAGGVSPTSTLCGKSFRVGRMKRALLSIVGSRGY